MRLVLVIAALSFCGVAYAGPVEPSEASILERAKDLAKVKKSTKPVRVKGSTVKAPSLELVREHFDAGQLSDDPSRTLSKSKRRLTIDRSKSATLIRLGDTSKPKAKKSLR